MSRPVGPRPPGGGPRRSWSARSGRHLRDSSADPRRHRARHRWRIGRSWRPSPAFAAPRSPGRRATVSASESV